jgi:hypothetical protein
MLRLSKSKNKIVLEYSFIPVKIQNVPFYTSEDLKPHPFGVLGFKSLLVT